MGLFYANLTVFQPPREELITVLRKLKRTAFLSPTIQGHTVVFDKAIEGQNTAVIEDFGTSLTSQLKCAALAAVLHDDDVLYFWLFSNGAVFDRYDSLPQYFDKYAEPGPPEGGDSELLCLAFGRLDRKKRVQALLRANILAGDMPKRWGEFERHRELAAALGIPTFVAGTCYSSIANGYRKLIPKEFEDVQFEAV